MLRGVLRAPSCRPVAGTQWPGDFFQNSLREFVQKGGAHTIVMMYAE